MANEVEKVSGPTADAKASYLVARAAWDERYGDLITRARNWRAAFFAICVLTGLLCIALVAEMRRSHVVPFVVAVNDLHQVVGMGLADETSGANPLLVQARLQQYIENARSVSSDPLVLKDRLTSVFDGTVLSSPAFNYLQELWRNDSPFTRAETETVQVSVHNVTQLSPTSYEVNWTEVRRDKSGNTFATEQWKGVLGVVISPPKDVDAARRNPLGIFVNSVTWSRSV